jgi:hypothetical protein
MLKGVNRSDALALSPMVGEFPWKAAGNTPWKKQRMAAIFRATNFTRGVHEHNAIFL